VQPSVYQCFATRRYCRPWLISPIILL
jgi:hypothetical protein